GVLPQISNCVLGRSNRSTCTANREITCGSKSHVSTIFCDVPQRTRFMECTVSFQGARARSTWAAVRFVSFSLCRSVPRNFIVSNTSCPRILTNRKARWGSALAVFQDTNQSRIMFPSGSSVKLLGVKAAISGQQLVVIHASQKTTRYFQSVRLRIN
ncbi:hypothetical protein TcCL_Unassigned03594, partial [Trypanosoma cruzi]